MLYFQGEMLQKVPLLLSLLFRKLTFSWASVKLRNRGLKNILYTKQSALKEQQKISRGLAAQTLEPT